MKTKNKNYFVYFTIALACLFLICFIFYKNSLTSIIYNNKTTTAVEHKQNEVKSSELNILFAGDVMLDRYIRKQINRYSTTEGFVQNYLNDLPAVNKTVDYVVANLEGPITESNSKSLNADGTYGTDLIFTFPTSTVGILQALNIRVVSLANNHTDNFYHAGYTSTKKFLSAGNINYFGNPYNTDSASNDEKLSEIVCQNDICVAYVGYNRFTTDNDPNIISQEIKRLKAEDVENKLDFIIVMPHWGAEYDTLSSQSQKDMARSWIDAGTDIVIGSHPHVIQESEIYKGKYIYFSLGNYIFDQWFSSDVQNGLVLNIKFTKVETGDKGSVDYKIEKSIVIDNNKNVFIDRDGVRYKK